MAGTVIGALRVTLGLDSGQFARGAGQAGRSLAGLRQGLVQVSAAMAAVGTAAFAMVAATARAANEVARQANIANTSADQFQRMAAAASTVGIEQEKLADILKDVNDRVGDFLQTGGGPMADFFENIAPQVGVTADMFRDLSGADALQLYVDTLERAGLSQADMTFYMEAMASDATALLPLLANNGAEFNRLGDAAAASGAVMSDSLIAKSADFRDAMAGLKNGLLGVRNEIAERLMPIFTDLINSMTANVLPVIVGIVAKVGEWMDAFRELPGPIQEAAAAIALALGVGGPVLAAIGLVSTAFSALVGAAGPIGLFIAAAAAIMTVWSVWGDDIKAAIGPALQWIGEAFDGIVSTIDTFIAKVVAAKTALLDLLNSNTAGNLAPDPRGPAPEVPGYQEFAPIGGAMSDGIGSGIESGNAEQQLRQYLDGLVTTAEDQLGIESPSRVFREIGQWISAGLGLGIQDGSPGVASAMGEVVGETTDTFAGISQALNQIKSTAQSAFTGLVRGTMTWRDALSNVLSKLADIALNSVFESLWGGLLGGLFGGGARGGHSLGGAFAGAGAGLMGFANGGQFQVGGVGGVDSQLVAFRASPNETVTIRRPDQMDGPGANLHVTVGVQRDGGLEAFVTDAAGRVVARAAPAIQRGAVAQVDEAMRATKRFGGRG